MCEGLEASFELLTRLIILHPKPILDLDKGRGNRGINWGCNWGREIALRKFLLNSFVGTQGRVAIIIIPPKKHSLGHWGGNTQGRAAITVRRRCKEASWVLGNWALQIPMGNHRNVGEVISLQLSEEGGAN